MGGGTEWKQIKCRLYRRKKETLVAIQSIGCPPIEMICAAEHCERQWLKTIPFLTNNNLTVPPLEQEWEPDNHPPSIPPKRRGQQLIHL